ncbi:MAG: SGNH/GDSL hydrolase family protein [Nanoarchaeota archaeon]
MEEIKQESKKKRFIIGIIKILITLAVIFVVIEVFLRIFFPQPVFKHTVLEASPQIFEESDDLVFELEKGKSTRHFNTIEEFNVSININSLGFRDFEFTKEKPNNVYRILFLGDSNTFGWGVEIENVFTEVLERKLNQNLNGSFEVINAGWAKGNSPDNYYVYLKNKEFELDPDLIIVEFSIFNDFEIHGWEIDNDGLPIRVYDNSFFIDEFGRTRAVNNITKGGFKDLVYRTNVFLTFHSHFYTLFKNYLRNILNYLWEGGAEPGLFGKNYTEELNHNINQTTRLILKMDELSKEDNRAFALVIIPRSVQVLEPKIKDKYGNLLNWSRPNVELTRLREEHDIKVLDLTPELRIYIKENTEQIYFQHDPHWNERGNEVVANMIYEWLLDEGLLPDTNTK